MRAQLTGTINVEVDAAPQQDLSRIMDEIRAQYEGITDKHRRDQETWFNEKVTSHNQVPFNLVTKCLHSPPPRSHTIKSQHCLQRLPRFENCD